MTVSQAHRVSITEWDRVKVRMQAILGDQAFQVFFHTAELEDTDDPKVVRISLVTPFQVKWAKDHYLTTLSQVLAEEGFEGRVVIVARPRGRAFIPPKTESAPAAIEQKLEVAPAPTTKTSPKPRAGQLTPTISSDLSLAVAKSLEQSQGITSDLCKMYVAQRYNIDQRAFELKGELRRRLNHPKFVAIYLVYKLAGLDIKQIGARFGDMSPIRVLAILREVEGLMQGEQSRREIQAHLEYLQTQRKLVSAK